MIRQSIQHQPDDCRDYERDHVAGSMFIREFPRAAGLCGACPSQDAIGVPTRGGPSLNTAGPPHLFSFVSIADIPRVDFVASM